MVIILCFKKILIVVVKNIHLVYYSFFFYSSFEFHQIIQYRRALRDISHFWLYTFDYRDRSIQTLNCGGIIKYIQNVTSFMCQEIPIYGQLYNLTIITPSRTRSSSLIRFNIFINTAQCLLYIYIYIYYYSLWCSFSVTTLQEIL